MKHYQITKQECLDLLSGSGCWQHVEPRCFEDQSDLHTYRHQGILIVPRNPIAKNQRMQRRIYEISLFPRIISSRRWRASESAHTWNNLIVARVFSPIVLNQRVGSDFFKPPCFDLHRNPSSSYISDIVFAILGNGVFADATLKYVHNLNLLEKFSKRDMNLMASRKFRDTDCTTILYVIQWCANYRCEAILGTAVTPKRCCVPLCLPRFLPKA